MLKDIKDIQFSGAIFKKDKAPKKLTTKTVKKPVKVVKTGDIIDVSIYTEHKEKIQLFSIKATEKRIIVSFSDMSFGVILNEKDKLELFSIGSTSKDNENIRNICIIIKKYMNAGINWQDIVEKFQIGNFANSTRTYLNIINKALTKQENDAYETMNTEFS